MWLSEPHHLCLYSLLGPGLKCGVQGTSAPHHPYRPLLTLLVPPPPPHRHTMAMQTSFLSRTAAFKVPQPLSFVLVGFSRASSRLTDGSDPASPAAQGGSGWEVAHPGGGQGPVRWQQARSIWSPGQLHLCW